MALLTTPSRTKIGIISGAMPGLTLFDLLFVADLVLMALIYSQSTTFFPAMVASLILYTCFAINVITALLSLRFNFFAGIIAILIILIIIGYQIVFHLQFHDQFTGKQIGGYPGLCAVGLFSIAMDRRGLDATLQAIYASCLIYLLIYLYLLHSLDAYAIMADQQEGGKNVVHAVLRAHGSAAASSGETEYRIMASGFHLAYALLYPLCVFGTHQRRASRALLVAGILLATYCLWKSDFRFNLFCTIIAAIAVMLPVISTSSKAILAFIFYMASTVGVILAWVFRINPYALFSSDASGAARMSELDAAIRVSHDVPLFGTGLPSDFSDYQTLFGSSTVAPSDIGYFGELLQYGFVGLLFLAVSHLVIFRLIMRAGRSLGSSGSQRVLLGCFVYMLMADLMMTVVLDGGGSLILSLALVCLWIPLRAPHGDENLIALPA